MFLSLLAWQQLYSWLEVNSDYAPFDAWLHRHNIGLQDFLRQLETNTEPVGLEVLAAINTLRSILQSFKVTKSGPHDQMELRLQT